MLPKYTYVYKYTYIYIYTYTCPYVNIYIYIYIYIALIFDYDILQNNLYTILHLWGHLTMFLYINIELVNE